MIDEYMVLWDIYEVFMVYFITFEYSLSALITHTHPNRHSSFGRLTSGKSDDRWEPGSRKSTVGGEKSDVNCWKSAVS